jgi:hypothetical protein
MRTPCLTARGARWRTSCVQSEEMPHAQPALHSRRAQQFAEAGLKIATDTAGVLGRSHSHWRKGEFDSGGRGSAREWRKCLTVVMFRIGLIAERWARTCFIRHPRSDINLS